MTFDYGDGGPLSERSAEQFARYVRESFDRALTEFDARQNVVTVADLVNACRKDGGEWSSVQAAASSLSIPVSMARRLLNVAIRDGLLVERRGARSQRCFLLPFRDAQYLCTHCGQRSSFAEALKRPAVLRALAEAERFTAEFQRALIDKFDAARGGVAIPTTPTLPTVLTRRSAPEETRRHSQGQFTDRFLPEWTRAFLRLNRRKP